MAKAKIVQRRRGDKQKAQRQLNSTVVENKDSHIQASSLEEQHYRDQMNRMFGDTQIPAVQYKGQYIPRRTLSSFSYLTKG